MDEERKMNEPLLEPLLGRSASRKISKKSEHPFLSLMSPSPRPKSDSGTLDNSLSSPSFSPYTSEERRGKSGHKTPFKRPYHGRLDLPTSAASGFNGAGSRPSTPDTPQAALLSIPEEPMSRSPTSVSRLPSQNTSYDLEALFREDRNDEGADDSNTGVFGEPLNDDAELVSAQDGKRWRASGLTRLLLSAIPSIPEVLSAFSSSPEDDYFEYRHKESRDHIRPDGNTSGYHHSSLPCLQPDSPICSGSEKKESAELPPQGFEAPNVDISVHRSGSFDEASLRKAKKKCHPLHKCRTAPMLTGLGSFRPKTQSKIRSEKPTPQATAATVVWQASLGLCIYLAVGVMVYTWKREEFRGPQTVGVVDALYFCIVTMCTIGYGDITPVTPTAKMLSCALVFIGFGFIDALMSGMLSFVLDRQEHILLTVVEDGHHERAKNYIMNSKKGRMRIRMKVALAVGTVLLTVLVGVLFLHFIERLKWIDALYVTSISITTVGFGDYSFQTVWGRLFAAVWLLLSTLMVARAFLFLAEARVHRRSRHLAKKILERKMTSDDLMSMDLDNDGHISKSEFVVYKLKEMGKIDPQDVVEICKQFDIIDSMGAGKITLGQLLHGGD